MNRRKKYGSHNRLSVSRGGEPAAIRASAAAKPDARPPQPADRSSQTGSRSYETSYSIASGYTAERAILLP